MAGQEQNADAQAKQHIQNKALFQEAQQPSYVIGRKRKNVFGDKWGYRRFVPMVGIPVLSLMACWTPAGAAVLLEFPEALRGVWDVGPAACKLPLHLDSDTPIAIERERLIGYESVDTPRRVTRVSEVPSAWVISTESSVAPGIVLEEVFVLKNEHLTITSGESARTYRRCR